MTKNLFLALCGFFVIAAFFSCNDDDLLGSSVQPGKDKRDVIYSTFSVNTKTVLVDSVYLRNSEALLGEFTDPLFGTTKSDYMAQLYCARDFSFPDDVNQIDSAYIFFSYSKWFGDSTDVHHVKVYELNKPLDYQSYSYSNTSPDNYIDWSNPLLIGQGTFTTGDLYTTDSVKGLSSYSPEIRIPISLSLGNRFLKDSRTNPDKFATPENFQKYFNGIYVTTDYGNGSILYISSSTLGFCYDTWKYSYTTNLRDSFVIGTSYFPVTKEVKQINRTEHVDLQQYLNPLTNDSLNYIFAPGGLFTQVTIPDSLFTKNKGILSGKTISSMRLKVTAVDADLDHPWKYAMKPPEALLLINADSAQSFFKKFEIADGLNSFTAKYDSTNLDYSFDMSYYAQKMVRENDSVGSTSLSPFTRMLIIPVSIVTNSSSTNVYLENLITPASVKIRSGKNTYQPMKLEVIYSKESG
jgi:hypothetical protein